jgi:hypothetical protein
MNRRDTGDQRPDYLYQACFSFAEYALQDSFLQVGCKVDVATPEPNLTLQCQKRDGCVDARPLTAL